MAKFLASRVPDINVEYGDTPILDEVVNNFNTMVPHSDTSDTYLSTGLNAAQVFAFFDAAAALHRSAPWKKVPHVACLLNVSIEALGIQDAVLSVIGQMGERFGIIVYGNIQQYCQYHIANDRIRRGLDCSIPPHAALSFDEGAEVSPAIRKEIAEHGWQVSSTSTYPVIFTPDRDNIIRPLAAADVALFEALSRALPAVLNDHRKLIQAWDGHDVFRKKITVDSLGESVAVEIGAPYPFEKGYASKDLTDTTMIEIALLAHTAEDPDFEAYGLLCRTLQNLFDKSPEGLKCLEGLSILTPLLELAFNYQSATIATLQAGALEEVVFKIVPRKVMVPPDHAREFIEELRLFYRFLKRQYALVQADDCLEVLGGNAISRLKAALADDSEFGGGKGVIASGMLADFDPRLIPPDLSIDHTAMDSIFPAPGGSGKPVDRQNKKRKRKAAKRARKKNR